MKNKQTWKLVSMYIPLERKKDIGGDVFFKFWLYCSFIGLTKVDKLPPTIESLKNKQSYNYVPTAEKSA